MIMFAKLDEREINSLWLRACSASCLFSNIANRLRCWEERKKCHQAICMLVTPLMILNISPFAQSLLLLYGFKCVSLLLFFSSYFLVAHLFVFIFQNWDLKATKRMGSTNMQILCKCIFSVAVTTLFAFLFVPLCLCLCERMCLYELTSIYMCVPVCVCTYRQCTR